MVTMFPHSMVIIAIILGLLAGLVASDRHDSEPGHPPDEPRPPEE
jgi:hypothetical protein